MERESKYYTVVARYMAYNIMTVVGLLIGMVIVYCSCYTCTVCFLLRTVCTCTLQGGRTALILAAWGGHTDTMQALAALGADIHIQDNVSPNVSCTQRVLKNVSRVCAD